MTRSATHCDCSDARTVNLSDSPPDTKVITPAQQMMMATRAHSKVTEIPDASHVSMISHPGAVTAVIERAAKAVG